MTSLRKRAIAGAIFWACAVTVAGTFLLGSFLQQQSNDRLHDLILARHDRVIVALANSGGDQAAMAAQLTDPIYQRPFSGEYWQVDSLDAGQVLTSRSLADALIGAPDGASPKLFVETLQGPADQRLLVTKQKITLSDRSQWVVHVGLSTDTLIQGQSELRDRLYAVFGLTGAFAGAGALLLVLVALRPVDKLRRDVAARWNSDGLLPAETYPVEVKPLVDDINTLLTRNRDIISRSRRQAADLAHALKTPSAILRNELQSLERSGVAVGGSLDALGRLDAQLKRTLARMRASQSAEGGNARLNVTEALSRMTRAFAALARNAGRRLQADVGEDLALHMDRSDLDEICGNLLDNALKWSQHEVRFTAKVSGDAVEIRVEDDGPGVPEAQRDKVLAGGTRLDEATPGTGLGLSIAHDLAAAYGGDVAIATSPNLGGACMIVTLPKKINAGQLG